MMDVTTEDGWGRGRGGGGGSETNEWIASWKTVNEELAVGQLIKTNMPLDWTLQSIA